VEVTKEITRCLATAYLKLRVHQPIAQLEHRKD